MSGTPLQSPDGPPDAAPQGVEAVLSLMRHVGQLAPRVDFERSFKLTHGRLSPDRFLLGVEAPRGTQGADQAITALCQTLGMPAEFLLTFQQALPDANHVYFGAERDQQSLTFKSYLEFRDKVVSQPCDAAGRPQAGELYVGYKWDARMPTRCAVSHYHWLRDLSPGEIERHAQGLVGGDPRAGLGAVTAAFFARALEAVTPQAIQFLEVREVGNPRRSFDINVYKMESRLADWVTPLQMAGEHFTLPAGALDVLLGRIGAERLGHVAAGVDRQGRDFLTLYYGGTTMDGSRLAHATLAPHAS